MTYHIWNKKRTVIHTNSSWTSALVCLHQSQAETYRRRKISFDYAIVTACGNRDCDFNLTDRLHVCICVRIVNVWIQSKWTAESTSISQDESFDPMISFWTAFWTKILSTSWLQRWFSFHNRENILNGLITEFRYVTCVLTLSQSFICTSRSANQRSDQLHNPENYQHAEYQPICK